MRIYCLCYKVWREASRFLWAYLYPGGIKLVQILLLSVGRVYAT
jgi:hypothetical protein